MKASAPVRPHKVSSGCSQLSLRYLSERSRCKMEEEDLFCLHWRWRRTRLSSNRRAHPPPHGPLSHKSTQSRGRRVSIRKTQFCVAEMLHTGVH
ncbi:hypothetical protein QQF64_009704 [Cirrhinus molitorella]|uniref:Uncharacterized protein n=1 Tax=Cirrhinus molitorella TaxID=172907 RepID=A0ABR3M1X6_9TELE